MTFEIRILETAKSTVKPGKAGTPTVTRTEFSEPTNPALDVTWTAPAANGATITGYGAQYRKKAAEGEEAAEWTAYSGTLSATTTTLTLSNLEAGATYEVQVRALSDEGDGPWSDTGSGRANRPPKSTEPANVQPSYTYLWGGDDGVITLNDKFTDDDGDTLTYSASAQYPGVFTVSIEGENSDKLRIKVLNPATSTVTYGVSDGYGGYASKTIDVSGSAETINGADLSRSVAENSAAGTAVGAPVTGTPYGEEALTYSLTGEAASSGAFVIDSATGQISVKQGATIDYEAKSSYTGRVNWTVQGQEAFADVTIDVTDVEAGKPDAPTVTRTQFSEPTNPALDVSWTAPAANGLTVTGYNAQYRKKAAEGENPAEWTAYGGTLGATATSLTLSDLEAGATYEVQVQAVTSGEGEGPWSDTASGRANRPPRSTEAPNLQPSYTYLWGGNDGVMTLNDKFADDDSDTLTYSASAQYPGVLRVGIEGEDSDKLRIHILNPATSTVTYAVSDGYGGHASKTIDVSGSADAFNGADLARSVAENSAAGTAVGDPVPGTPYDDGDDETNDALTYTLTGEAATSGAFVIDSATGQISVKQGATIDFETKSSYTGKVSWTVQGQAAVADLTINVTDLEAGKPAAPTVTRTAFTEPTNPALDVTWTAPAANGLTISGYNVQYRKQVAQGETPNAWTTYTDNVNDTTVLPANTTTLNLPDLEAGATYEFQVRAQTRLEGPGPWSDTGSGRANSPPGLTSVFLIDWQWNRWNRPATTMEDFRKYFNDTDGDTLTPSVQAQYPGILNAWVIDNGVHAFANLPLNPGQSKMTYGAHDGYGGFISRDVTLTFVDNQTRQIAENSAAGTAVGDPVTGTPYDDGDDETDDALTYTLTGEAATSGAFVIDSATGQISVQEDANLDYETKSSYTGKVNWTVQGQAVFATVTIDVTDLEAGKPDAPTVTRTRFDKPTHPALDVAWTAPDANGTTINGYEVQYRKKVADGQPPNGWTTYFYTDADDNVTSKLPASTLSLTLPNLLSGSIYEFQVRAVTSLEGSGPWSDTGSARANVTPNGRTLVLTSRTYGFNTVATAYLDRYYYDLDGDTLTWFVSSQYPGLVGFDLTQSTSYLIMRFLNPGTSTLTYGAHDGYGGFISRTVKLTTGSRSATRSVAENSAAGTAVGDPVLGNSYSGQTETFSYTLTGEASTSGAFVIDSASGQISVKQGASLDHETKSSYTGKVGYTVNGQATVINLTINLTDAEAGKPDAPTVSRTRFEEKSNPALDVTWTAPDANGTTIDGYKVQYRKQVADGETPNAWTAYTYTDANERVIVILPASTLSVTVPDLEAGATYDFQVRATTAKEGHGPWSDSGEGRANRPPHYAVYNGVYYFLVNNNQPVGKTWVGWPIEIYYVDPDGDTLSWDVSSQYPGIGDVGEFQLKERPAEYPFLTDEMTLRPTFEFFNPGTLDLTYGVHDGYGGYIDRKFSWTGKQTETRAIAENSPAGTAVGEPVPGRLTTTATIRPTMR